MNKSKELSKCDFAFLLSLAKDVNLSHKYYDEKDKSNILNILQNKFDIKSIKNIVDLYYLCYNVETVAKTIKPDSSEKIANSLHGFFGEGRYLYEVRIGRRICDAIIIKNDLITSIEIKTASDKVERALEQIKDYKIWSNQVYLLYDIKHKDRVQKISFKEEGIGLLEYRNGYIMKKFESELNKPKSSNLLELMSYSYLKNISKYKKIKTKENKKRLVEVLSKVISDNQARELFQKYLKS